jgi:hypothetical protein
VKVNKLRAFYAYLEPPGWIALGQRLMDELEIPESARKLFWWKNAANWLALSLEEN